MCASLVTCTISDDNGDLADPGENPVDNGDTWQPIPGLENPVFVVAPVSSSVFPGDTQTVRFILIDEDNFDTIPDPIANVRVAVSVSPSTTGWWEDTVTTDQTGSGEVHFVDTVQGERVLYLRYGGEESLPIRFTVSTEPQVDQPLITIRPAEPTLVADGESQTEIYVTVINEDHNPLVGEEVRFIATAGVVAGSNPPSDDMSGVAVTNADGIATAMLTSTDINDTSYITAYLLSDLSMTAQTQVAFFGVRISLDADTTNINVGQNLLVDATVVDGSENPIANAPVYFNLGKSTNSNFLIVERDSVTGFQGEARVLLNGAASGTDSLVVSCGGARAVVLLNVTNLKLNVQLAETNLVANDTVSTTLTVDFTDINNAPLSGRVVRVIRYYPAPDRSELVDTLTNSYTNASGRATFEITGLGYDAEMRLAITAFNTLTDVATAETFVRFSTTRNLTIEALPTIIQADGSSESQITVQIKTDEGNPIVGDTVLFSTTAGLVTEISVTDGNGRAMAVLQSDRRNVTARVKATLKRDTDRKDSVSVVFTGIDIASNLSPRSVRASGRDTAQVFARVTDAMGNPIPGEPINFTAQQDSTTVVWADAVTDNDGEARCQIVGTGVGSDTIRIVAAGATATQTLHYAENILTVSVLPGQALVADGMDSTQFMVQYLLGDSATPIAGAEVQISATLGSIALDPATTVFAKKDTTGASGEVYFWLKNPLFSNTATITVEAQTTSEVTSAKLDVYFRADAIDHIKLRVTPSVIGINGDKATITAEAYDAENNRVANAPVAFNLLEGPGGEERLDPPTTTTNGGGIATSSLVSGSIPSMYKEVAIVAGDFFDGTKLRAIKSDTVYVTIAGPPKYITLRTNIKNGIDNGDGTFELPCAAIVSDINGNPVADGSEVTFSVRVSGYRVWTYRVDWPSWLDDGYAGWYTPDIDSISKILPFEDFNDNFKLDPGEDRNHDGILGRGEDLNGNGIYFTGPGFEDINHNGRRDWSEDPEDPVSPEPWRPYLRGQAQFDTTYTDSGDPVVSASWQYVNDTAYADYNGNGNHDTIEALLNDSLAALMTWADYKAMEDTAQGGFGFDVDFDGNGVADPATAVSMERTVQTEGGKATNSILYGQSDALRIEVMITAECQGVTVISPEFLILPFIE